jgi:hypothetical protein
MITIFIPNEWSFLLLVFPISAGGHPAADAVSSVDAR